MSQRIEPTFPIWVKELNPFLNMTQRIEKFSWFFDSKNWTFFEYDSKMWIFLECDSQNWTFLLTQRNEFFFSEWQRFCWIRLKELNLCLNMSHRIEPVLEFHSMDWTLCTKGLKELDPKRLFEQQNLLMTWWIGPFFLFDSKNWIFSQKYHAIIDLFWHHSQNWTPF